MSKEQCLILAKWMFENGLEQTGYLYLFLGEYYTADKEK